jgi:NAD(P)-dependent dehydrogenase (short-subunit alcohol dehydrogenase family)
MGIGGARVLVVGASAGIGRAVGVTAAGEGAHVAFAARRKDRLEEVVAEVAAVSPRSVAVELDVRDEASVVAGIASTVDQLGGLDAVVHCAGVASVAALADVDAARWREVLETNLIGSALVANAAIPHLAASGGVLFLCSSTTDERHRWGLSAYGVSKAGVNRLVESLRAEHTDVRFVRATIGSTLGTEFGDSFDGEVLTEAMTRWVAGAQHDASYMSLASLADTIVRVLDTLLAHPDVDISRITIEPPGGPLTLPPMRDMLDTFFGSMTTRRERSGDDA